MDTTPIPIGSERDLLSHNYDGGPCPVCSWREYLAVRLRLGSEKAEEFVSHEYDEQTIQGY